MHDTAMLLGALGWSAYDAPVEVDHAVFRRLGHRPAQRDLPGHAAGAAAAIPRPVASRAEGYTSVATDAADMPHLVILYTPQLDAETDMTALCRSLADAMLTVKDEAGTQVFPTGGTRVFAYPAAHHSRWPTALATTGFCYFNLRMGRGRSAAVQQAAGAGTGRRGQGPPRPGAGAPPVA